MTVNLSSYSVSFIMHRNFFCFDKYIFFPNMYGSRDEDFLGFNTFSLYDYIGPALGPKCSRGHEFHDEVGLCDHNNHAFIFHKYI